MCIVAGVFCCVGFDINVTDLYHGTTCPLDQICAEGLDPRISVHGHFGRGIYFRFALADSFLAYTAKMMMMTMMMMMTTR